MEHHAAPSRHLGWVVLLLAVLAASRLAFIHADPPLWMEPGWMTDEGEWSDPAKAKALFGSYFANDLGTALFMAPLYTWVLQATYSVAGIGLIPTRIWAAIGTILAALLAAGFLWRRGERAAAAITLFLLAISPFYWAYGRVAFIEGAQVAAVILAFVLWFARSAPAAAALGAGLAAGAAVLFKPSAVYSCIAPLMATALILGVIRRQPGQPWLSRRGIVRFVLFIAGGLIAAIPLLVLVIAPHWDAYWRMLYFEGGSDRIPFRTSLTLPGSVMVSLNGGQSTVWKPLLFSPLIALSLWLALVWHAAHSRGRYLDYFRMLRPVEQTVLAFTLLQTALLLARSWKWNADHYYIAVLPFWAMSSALFLKTFLAGKWRPREDYSTAGLLHRFVLAVLVSLPLYVILKPFAASYAAHLARDIVFGKLPGISVYAMGVVFTAAWLAALALITLAGRNPAHRVAMPWLRAVLAAALLIEVLLLGLQYTRMAFSLDEAQREIAGQLAPGEMVLGSGGSTLCMGAEVKTTRRVVADDRDGFAHPPPNPHVWEKYHPRYILEKERFNFSPSENRYETERAKGYRLVDTYTVGHAGMDARFVFRLYEMTPQLRRATGSGSAGG